MRTALYWIKKARIITQEGQSREIMGTRKRGPWCSDLEHRSGGKFKFDFTKSCKHHLIVFLAQNIYFYDIFHLLKHNGKDKNKYKSYFGTYILKSKFPAIAALKNLSTGVLVFVYPLFPGTGTPCWSPKVNGNKEYLALELFAVNKTNFYQRLSHESFD